MTLDATDLLRMQTCRREMRRWLLANAPEEIRMLYYETITLSEQAAVERTLERINKPA